MRYSRGLIEFLVAFSWLHDYEAHAKIQCTLASSHESTLVMFPAVLGCSDCSSGIVMFSELMNKLPSLTPNLL